LNDIAATSKKIFGRGVNKLVSKNSTNLPSFQEPGIGGFCNQWLRVGGLCKDIFAKLLLLIGESAGFDWSFPLHSLCCSVVMQMHHHFGVC